MLTTTRLQPWSTYSVFLTTITAWALPWDLLLVYLLGRTTVEQTAERRLQLFGLYLCWWLAARVVKLIGHFHRYPWDLFLLPCSVLFGYFHCMFIKTWALCTLNQVCRLLYPSSEFHAPTPLVRAARALT